MKVITVNVLEYTSITFSHVDVALKERDSETGEVRFLCLDRWQSIKKTEIKLDHSDYNYALSLAARNEQFYVAVEGGLDAILKVWKKILQEAGEPSLIFSNCADGVKWFLESIDVLKEDSLESSLGCHHFCGPIYLPTFFQPLTLPDRVMELTKKAVDRQSLRDNPIVIEEVRAAQGATHPPAPLIMSGYPYTPGGRAV